MALVRCPECQREVSDQAQTCPGCGHPLGETALRPGAAPYRYEFKSHIRILGLPLVHIVYGPAWLVGFKPAKGIIAIGNMAVGVIAIGGLAAGLVTISGIGFGLACLGGVALGIGLGVGGLATGYIAIGGFAVGYYAIGGLGIGGHTLQSDPHLLDLLRKLLPR